MTILVRNNMINLNFSIIFSTEIILAGLHPRTLYLTAKGLYNDFSRAELSGLWKFQYLCLVLNFRIEKQSLDHTIGDVKDAIEAETDSVKVQRFSDHLSKLLWVKHFQSSPLPLTYLCRIAIRKHLVNPVIGGVAHLNTKIGCLPLPNKCVNFLMMKQFDIRTIHDHMTV